MNLTIVEKVLFLQDVDIFEHITTDDLSHIAAITEDVYLKKDETIYRQGGISDSMYLMVEGSVRLRRDEKEVMIAGPKDAFGTWALFDDDPRMVTAAALEECHLLRIARDDFLDLLADHNKITQSVLKTLSKRLRSLIEVVKVAPKSETQ